MSENEIKEMICGKTIEFPNGEYKTVCYEDGKLIAGDTTNNGMFHDFGMEYDKDKDLDTNLQDFYEMIIERHPEYLGEEYLVEGVSNVTAQDILDELKKTDSKIEKYTSYEGKECYRTFGSLDYYLLLCDKFGLDAIWKGDLIHEAKGNGFELEWVEEDIILALDKGKSLKEKFNKKDKKPMKEEYERFEIDSCKDGYGKEIRKGDIIVSVDYRNDTIIGKITRIMEDRYDGDIIVFYHVIFHNEEDSFEFAMSNESVYKFDGRYFYIYGYNSNRQKPTFTNSMQEVNRAYASFSNWSADMYGQGGKKIFVASSKNGDLLFRELSESLKENKKLKEQLSIKDEDELSNELYDYLKEHPDNYNMQVKTEEEKDFVVRELKSKGYTVEVSGDDTYKPMRYHIEYFKKGLNEDYSEDKYYNVTYVYRDDRKIYLAILVIAKSEKEAERIVKQYFAKKEFDIEIIGVEEISERMFDDYKRRGKSVLRDTDGIKENKRIRTMSKRKLNESTETDRKQLLADYLGIDIKDIKQCDYDDNCFETEEGEEYLVVNEDEARKYAYDDIESTFEDLGLEAFTEDFQQWIFDNALDSDWFEEAERESNEFYVDDIAYENDDRFENRLIAELYDNGILTEDDFEDFESDRPILKAEVDIDEKKEEYIDQLYEEDAIEWYKVNFGFGRDFTDMMRKGDGPSIDMDKVVEECIDWDGIAHFIAHYDGKEHDLGNGFYAYRTN